MSTLALNRDGFRLEDWDRVKSTERYKNYELVPVAAVFLALSYFSLGLRLWTRSKIKHILGLDDVLMGIAQVSVRRNVAD
jgi:hypothetical protein